MYGVWIHGVLDFRVELRGIMEAHLENTGNVALPSTHPSHSRTAATAVEGTCSSRRDNCRVRSYGPFTFCPHRLTSSRSPPIPPLWTRPPSALMPPQPPPPSSSSSPSPSPPPSPLPTFSRPSPPYPESSHDSRCRWSIDLIGTQAGRAQEAALLVQAAYRDLLEANISLILRPFHPPECSQ